MIIRDKLGWPVEKFVDRPFTNFIRILIHGNIRQTYRKLHKEKVDKDNNIIDTEEYNKTTEYYTL